MCTNDLQKLRKCPFCGGEATGYEWSDDDEIDEGEPHAQDAYCAVAVDHKDDCLLKVGEFYMWIASTEKEAAEAWNTRAERTCMLASTQLTHHGPCGNTYHTHKIVCSECRHDMPDHGESIKYCPWCGAKVVEL